MKDVILFWMQGSWKWTQWKLLAQKFNYKMFETGQELRNIISSWSELWNKIQWIINSWNLVGTTVIMEVIENFLENISPEDSVIFDWLPRNLEQYDAFEALVKKHNRSPVWIHISLTKDEALTRLVKRFTCVWVDTTNNPLMTESECVALWGEVKKRADDTPEAIEKRLDVFFSETVPVIKNYKTEWRMLEINWLKNVEEVAKQIEREIK